MLFKKKYSLSFASAAIVYREWDNRNLSIIGKIDLHVHSCCSDGTDRPAELVKLARQAGLTALALTDHDTINGLSEFIAASAGLENFTAVPGVEISSRYGARELHILGLFIDYTSPRLLAFLDQLRQERLERARTMAVRLASLGYPLDVETLFSGPNGDAVGRPHFATMLVENYQFTTVAEVFDTLLKRGAPAYVARRLPDPLKVIQEIHACGGMAIWAHPIYRESRERSWARRVLRHLVPAGLDGVEAYYTSFAPEQTRILLQLAEEFQLAVTGGSDYHGSRHPEIALGCGYGNLAVDAGLLAKLVERQQTRYISA